jgi:hypothetical protein
MTDIKKCSDCKEIKAVTEFNKNKAKKDGYGSKCRDCMKIYRKAHYLANPERIKANVQAAREERKRGIEKYLLEYLLEHPCIDCGNNDPRVLEFDHINPALKTINVSQLLGGDHIWSTVYEEIVKCEVRCANCHRIRTQRQFSTFRVGWIV